jgi:meiotically up-regulated gene 157 (Mug157) protein
MRDPTAMTNLSWAQHDRTAMKPGVAERKWEIDSLCWPVRLAYGYWRATGDLVPLDDTWREAARTIVSTFRVQQRKDGNGPYHFQRQADNPVDTLGGGGYGAPTRKVGLIHSGFRPSDDACVYPFLVPSNHFAVISLRQLAEMAPATGLGAAFAEDALSLANEITAALVLYGRTHLRDGTEVWAYEVDGYGNTLFMDDANTPGLLGLAYLGAAARSDPLYQATRKAVWSDANPYFFRGSAAEGLGGPHIGAGMIWPMSLTMYALTSRDDGEIAMALRLLKTTTAGTGFMHEAFDKDDPAKFTRPWFAWANTLFGELILDLAGRKPQLL